MVWDPESQHYVLALTEEEEIAQSRKVTWTFIFVDLIFLALVTKCASVLTACSLSVHTIMFCSIVITIMFVTRLHMDDYCNRFYENDLFHRILLFLYALCMFVMTLNVNAINTNGDPSDAGCEADLYVLCYIALSPTFLLSLVCDGLFVSL